MKADAFCAALIILTLLWACFEIITPVYGYTRSVNESEWTYPDIPKCDRELWLRIKDGCE